MRMQRLRGQIATELADKGGADPRNLVRRAVLTVESDRRPDPELLNAAIWAAMQLLDLRLAESLAERAVAAGSGLGARIAQVMALTWQERGHDAERVLGELADQAPSLCAPDCASSRSELRGDPRSDDQCRTPTRRERARRRRHPSTRLGPAGIDRCDAWPSVGCCRRSQCRPRRDTSQPARADAGDLRLGQRAGDLGVSMRSRRRPTRGTGSPTSLRKCRTCGCRWRSCTPTRFDPPAR